MYDYPAIYRDITRSEEYQRNLDWGAARAGHPEGSVRAHISEIEKNLELLKSRLSDEEYWKLKILIHTHDTFEADAKRGVPITDPNSHASLAKGSAVAGRRRRRSGSCDGDRRDRMGYGKRTARASEPAHDGPP